MFFHTDFMLYKEGMKKLSILCISPASHKHVAVFPLGCNMYHIED